MNLMAVKAVAISAMPCVVAGHVSASPTGLPLPRGRLGGTLTHHHLDVIANHQDVGGDLQPLGLDGALHRAFLALQLEPAVARQEEDPAGEREREQGLSREAHEDLCRA